MPHVMKIVAIVAQKGGTGKSTLTANLAVAAARQGLRTLVVDADPQASLLDWKRSRGPGEPSVLAAKPSAIHPTRFAAERAGVDIMLIDTRASALDASLEAAKPADLTLVVVRPSIIDLRAIAATVDSLRPLQRPAAFVINQAPSRRSACEARVVSEAVEVLLRFGLPIAPVALRSRSIYPGAFSQGRSPLEIAPDGAAAAELGGLWSYVSGRLQQPAPLTSILAPLRPRALELRASAN
jgi:chromosome partitioning protein